jgi:acetyl esterase/lipase
MVERPRSGGIHIEVSSGARERFDLHGRRKRIARHQACHSAGEKPRAAEWGLKPGHIGVMGFSAGGELAALASTQYDAGVPRAADPVQRESSKPAFQALLYPAIPRDLTLSKDTPPAFLVCGEDDRQDIAQGLPELYLALKRAGVSAEIHVYAGVGHGFGIRQANGAAVFTVAATLSRMAPPRNASQDPGRLSNRWLAGFSQGRCWVPESALQFEDSLHQEPFLAGFCVPEWLLELPHEILPLLNFGVAGVGFVFGCK